MIVNNNEIDVSDSRCSLEYLSVIERLLKSGDDEIENNDDLEKIGVFENIKFVESSSKTSNIHEEHQNYKKIDSYKK